MERWLDRWLDSMRGGILPRGCVSHSESIAELGWVVPKMFVKSSKRRFLRWCCTINLGVESSGFHVISFLHTCGSLPFSRLSLTSPFPVSIDADDLQDWRTSSNRCPHQSPINFPTQSSCDDMFWGSGSITRQWSTHTANLIPVLSIWQVIQ